MMDSKVAVTSAETEVLGIPGIGRAILAVWLLVAIIDGSRLITWALMRQQSPDYQAIALHSVGGAILWTLLSWCILRIVDHCRAESFLVSVLLTVVLIIVATLVAVFANSAVIHYSGLNRRMTVVDTFIYMLGVDFHATALWIVIVVAVGRGVKDHFAAELRRLRQSNLETQLVRAQLQGLSAQLRPHFLFNTLHAINNMMRRDVDAASVMISELGDLLRYSLSQARGEFTTLADELHFSERYLHIQCIRLGNRLDVRIDAASDTGEAVVPRFLLQPLVENAIRHGIEPSEAGGEIVIVTRWDGDRLMIAVRNSSSSVPDWRSRGIGLGSVRERLALLYGADHRIECESDAASVTVTLSLPRRLGQAELQTV